jgi:hypothetical protein
MANKKTRKLLSAGSEITGTAIGGVLGLLIGGPVGSVAGGALGTGIAKGLQEVADRALSEREQVRVGATATFAIMRIQEKIDAGQLPRTDDFFASDDKKRRKADEILEGTLLAAKNTHEEKKAKYLGHLFANISFDVACTPSEANLLIKQLEQLTYSQLVLLKIFNYSSKYNLRYNKYGASQGVHVSTLALLQEILDLCRRSLVIMQEDGMNHHTIILEINQIRPKILHLAISGQRLYSMADLDSIIEEDVQQLLVFLQ